MNTATPIYQQPSFLFLLATQSGGIDEKTIKEQMYSKADLKEKREAKPKIVKEDKNSLPIAFFFFKFCKSLLARRGRREEVVADLPIN